MKLFQCIERTFKMPGAGKVALERRHLFDFGDNVYSKQHYRAKQTTLGTFNCSINICYYLRHRLEQTQGIQVVIEGESFGLPRARFWDFLLLTFITLNF